MPEATGKSLIGDQLTQADILVVGAGPAGLAVAAALRRAGLPYAIVDRTASVGDSWRSHYDRLHLHTAKEHSGLPFSPWPRQAPRFPSRDEVVAYLQRYADEHRIAPRFGVEVRRVRRESGRYFVETSDGPLQPRFVIVATGYNNEPYLPELAGLRRFAGAVVHAHAYRSARPYAGTRTLVVGCGNSGAEIALDLAEHGVEAGMVVRGPVHVVPRELFGRPTQTTSIMLSPLPVAVRDALVAPVLRLAVGDLSRWGIVRPAAGPARTIEERGRVPLIDIGTIAAVKAGRIRVFPGIQEVLADRVRFVDGRSEAFDTIVLATGYRPALGRFIEGYESISDERGRPHRFGRETGIPGLFFVGFRNPPTGALREISIEAPLVAAAIRAQSST